MKLKHAHVITFIKTIIKNPYGILTVFHNIINLQMPLPYNIV